jgi:hypothetical protein
VNEIKEENMERKAKERKRKEGGEDNWIQKLIMK